MDRTTEASDDGEVEPSFGGDTQLQVDMAAAKSFGASAPPTRVGGYAILRELGSGGMGVVYVGYDDRLDRRVAIKLLRGAHGNEGARVRLQREAQAMARLAHPNVVMVHEVGVHDEELFLAMELVEGHTLRAWLKAERRPWRAILAMFRQAGAGLAAAHEAGIVHRDFKPDNVLVGGDARPRVADFGLAQATTSASEDPEPRPASSSAAASLKLTRTGAIMGSPAYMAPEQFEGRHSDARTDQFGFCVALWEALYDQRPFGGESFVALCDAVTQGRRRPPPRASKVPAWLRDVIARGLAVDPAARWPSMQALLDALDSGRRRAGIRRFAIAMGAVVVIGGSGYTWQRWDRARDVAEGSAACDAKARAIDEIWNDEARASLERAFIATGSPLAADSWVIARDYIDDYANEWTRARTRLCIETEVEASRDPEAAEQARSCLDERLTTLVQYNDIFARIDADGVIASTPVLGRLQAPDQCLDESVLATRPRPPPELRDPAAALRARMIRVDTLLQMWILVEAKVEAEAALADAQALAWPPLEAEALYRLGRVQQRLADHDAAAEKLERALFLAAEHGVDTVAVQAAATLAYAAYERGEFARGLHWGRVGKMILARSELDLELAEAQLHQTIASVHFGQGAHDEALAEYREARAIVERRLPPDHPDLATNLQSTCLVQAKRGEYDEATELCRRALAIYERSLPLQHPDRGAALNTIAVMHLERGAPDQALPFLIESLAVSEATLPAEHPDFGFAYTNLGVAYIDSGDPAKALPEFQRAIDLWTNVLRADHPLLAYPLEGKGRALTELGEPEQAVALLEQVLVMRSNEAGDPSERAMTQYHLARALGADPLTRPHALEQARAALEIMRAANDTTQSAKIEAWLATASK